MIIRPHHLRLPRGARGKGYCVKKSREWAEGRGIDWRKFVQDGIDSEELRATGDPMAIALVDAAEAANG